MCTKYEVNRCTHVEVIRILWVAFVLGHPVHAQTGIDANTDPDTDRDTGTNTERQIEAQTQAHSHKQE